MSMHFCISELDEKAGMLKRINPDTKTDVDLIKLFIVIKI